MLFRPRLSRTLSGVDMGVLRMGGLASLAALLLSCSLPALSASVDHLAPQVKESIAHPRGWIQGARAPADHVLELRIALPQPNFHVLEQHLYEVSDPDHARYGQHLAKLEVDALVAPHPENLRVVDRWLAEHGLNAEDIERSSALDWVKVRVPVSLAEEMLHTVGSIKLKLWSPFSEPIRSGIPRVDP